MLENPILNELIDKYRENKLSHAYLIETNDEEKTIKELKQLIKIINCKETYQESCKKCNLCNLIDINNLPSLKIITPEGTSIKKNQIEELKNSFATIPIYSKFNIYIIKSAEKLNSSSANTMLKFLEEPELGILGFFITTNKDIIIDTIKSRCQSLVVKYNKVDLKEKLQISEELYDNYIKVIQAYLTKINSSAIINHKKEILNIFPERTDVNNIIEIIFQIYYENFCKKNNLEYNHVVASIYEIPEDSEKIIQKLKIITNLIQNMRYNVSIEQQLDKFVIEMRDSNG